MSTDAIMQQDCQVCLEPASRPIMCDACGTQTCRDCFQTAIASSSKPACVKCDHFFPPAAIKALFGHHWMITHVPLYNSKRCRDEETSHQQVVSDEELDNLMIEVIKEGHPDLHWMLDSLSQDSMSRSVSLSSSE